MHGELLIKSGMQWMHYKRKKQ